MRRVIVIIVAIFVLTPLLLVSTFHSISVCKKCGDHRFVTEFQLPWMDVTYWSHAEIKPTPTSTAAQKLGFIPAHSHDWQFIHGGGNGIACALGRGGPLHDTMRCPEFAQFLVCTQRYRGDEEARQWFQTALDQSTTFVLPDWLMLKNFPRNGFASEKEYNDWRDRADETWQELLAMYESK